MEEEEFNFFQLSSRGFESLAATVIQDKYQIPLLSFSEGRDGGRDAAARNVPLSINSETPGLSNIVVQVKHTRARQRKMDSGTRQSLLTKELPKVKRLVADGEINTYIIVTNYRVSAIQEQEIVRMFSEAGCGHVVVVGYETLVRWIKESDSLKKKLWSMYGVGGPNLRALTKMSITATRSTDKKLSLMLEKVDDLDKVKGRGQEKELTQVKRDVKIIRNEVKDSTKGIRSGVSELSSPLKSIQRSVSCTEQLLHVLSDTVQQNQKTLLSLKRKSLRKSDSAPAPPRKLTKISETKDINLTNASSIPEPILHRLTGHSGLLREWRFVARSLGLSEADLVHVTVEYPSLREQAYQAMRLWIVRSSSVNHAAELVQVLRQSNLNAAANELVPLLTNTSSGQLGPSDQGGKHRSQHVL